MNNNGEIAANLFDNGSQYRTALYHNGVLQDISAQVYPVGGINDAGQIATSAGFFDATGFHTQAALYNIHTGQTQIVGPSNAFSTGNYVNQNGDVIGLVAAQNTPQQTAYAALFRNGQTTQLSKVALLPLVDEPLAINNYDQVVGRVIATDGTNTHAVLYSNGASYDLGTLSGGHTAAATGINDSGAIVGYSDGTGIRDYHPFLYQNGKMQDLGTFGGPSGSANGINSAGVVTGEADVQTDPNGRIDSVPFVYSGGVMRNLFDLIPDGASWNDGYGDAINDKGQIAGEAFHNGALHIFLATPVAVPEPAPVLTLALGVGLLALRRRRVRAV